MEGLIESLKERSVSELCFLVGICFGVFSFIFSCLADFSLYLNLLKRVERIERFIDTFCLSKGLVGDSDE